MKLLKNITLSALAFILAFSLQAQQKAASPFDFGKMWTFENPPTDWFKEAYGFEADEAWFKDVRMSSLRFASWCSASFVSPDGLIMTNHHCSRDVSTEVQNDDENFDKAGFYAETRADERKVEGLFVEQLVQAVDITDQVMTYTKNAENEADELEKRATALEAIQAKYAEMEGWENLRMQTITYYSGGKFSLYGYKKYDDIRLVFLPELDLGFYGGDPDNFTYPRYNLDVTFWRAYDENGNPVNTSKHYLEFNPDGVHENEPTFVVGNPGSTERYRTVAQLEYDREYRFNQSLKFRTNRHDIMLEEYNQIKDDPTKEKEAQELLGNIFNLSNGMKAIGGILKGLHNDDLMGRKIEMENNIRTQSGGASYWDELAAAYETLKPHSWAINHLSPSPLRGKTWGLVHQLYQYEQSIASEASEEDLEAARMEILAATEGIDTPEEKRLFKVLLTELSEDIYPGNSSLKDLMGDMSVDDYVTKVYNDTRFTNGKKADKCLKKPNKVKKDKDPLLQISRSLVPQYFDAVTAFRSSSTSRRALEAKIANAAFQVYGTSLPPDATFTLRISDGIVTGYDYNGTVAPYKTTYFGLYDRHYSNDQETPWSIPEKWMDPPMELLKAPINFVSTNDIIGGNSGSPMINKKGEAIGLIFDGNIESLPGNFIFDEEYNRTVSVHAGGIYAALKYIYKADRLYKELVPEN
jgi:V8-like Glu-specific endopeptidase